MCASAYFARFSRMYAHCVLLSVKYARLSRLAGEMSKNNEPIVSSRVPGNKPQKKQKPRERVSGGIFI